MGSGSGVSAYRRPGDPGHLPPPPWCSVCLGSRQVRLYGRARALDGELVACRYCTVPEMARGAPGPERAARRSLPSWCVTTTVAQGLAAACVVGFLAWLAGEVSVVR